MTAEEKECILDIHEKMIFGRGIFLIYHCGDVSGEVPPVLIPNTVVKLTCADNT